MFSRKERDYLLTIVLATRRGVDPERRLAARFPRPVYRRKLLWSIREKAERALADWNLYNEAAATERRILPPRHDPPNVALPVYSDPLFVPAIRGLERGLARLRRPIKKERSISKGKRKEA
ncbi:MAG: hypothetical protein WB778_05165 [Thermoplasmata archaeon]